MAATVTITTFGGPDGRSGFCVNISETAAESTSEVSIEGMPCAGRVLRQICDKEAGVAAYIDPVIGTATDPTATENQIYANGTAAETVNNDINSGVGAPYYSPTGTLYHRSQPESGTDNVIATTYLIQAGW